MELNSLQKAAVELSLDASTKVSAGAGTGKTRVLVRRYLKFVTEDGVAPERLLALTFTLKAAVEMRERIFRAIDSEALRRSLYGAWIMNFHAFGLRVLQENAPAFGIDPGVGVATPADLNRVKAVLKRRFVTGELDGMPIDFGGALPSPSRMDAVFDVLMKAMYKCRDRLLPPERLRDSLTDLDRPGYMAAIQCVSALGDAYESELDRRNLIDFGGMINRTIEGLRTHPTLAQSYTDRFEHILVDEFQDTSLAQNELLLTLSGGDFHNVTVVGDEKQSIYRWRDARVENIREFKGRETDLTVNYRSTQGILDLAHALICQDPHFGERADAIKLEADRGAGEAPIVLFHPDGAKKSPAAEARALAGWVRHLTTGAEAPGLPVLVGGDSGREPLALHDVAVLLRSATSNSALPHIENCFQGEGIPYTLVGGANALESSVLESLQAFLSLLLPDCGTRDLIAALEADPFGVDDRSIMELFTAARAVDAMSPRREGPLGSRDELVDVDLLLSDAVLASVSNPPARERCVLLRALVADLRRRWTTQSFRTFLVDALHHTPFAYRLFDEGVTPQAVENLMGELLGIADGLSARGELSLHTFLENLRACVDTRRFHGEGESELPQGQVRIMTIHQAKGLEFPAVAVCGVTGGQSRRGGFFLSQSDGLFFGEKHNWGREYRELPEYEEEKRMESQEERCVLYVAMTRARDYLYVSSPLPGGLDHHRRSTLFTEVLSCAALGGVPYVELRQPPGQPADGVPLPSAAPPPADVESLHASWQAAAGLLAATSESVVVPSAPITLFAWPALKLFAQNPESFRERYLLGVGSAFAGEHADPGYTWVDEKGDRLEGVALPSSVDRAEFGLFIHELLERRLTDPLLSMRSTTEILQEVGSRYAFDEKALPRVLEEAKRVFEGFVESPLAKAPADVRLEEPFQVRLGHAVFHGRIDRLQPDGDGWRIIDYKIGGMHEDYTFQLNFYAWAMGKISAGTDVSAELWFLGEGKPRRQTVSDRAAIEAIDAHALQLDQLLSHE